MKICVQVTDGIHALPAEGVEVTLVSHRDGYEAGRICECTDRNGQVSYTMRPNRASAETYHVEIDARVYFTSLGICCRQPKIAVFFHALEPDEEYELKSLIGPSLVSTYYTRRLPATPAIPGGR